MGLTGRNVEGDEAAKLDVLSFIDHPHAAITKLSTMR